ncbi:30S ribosomal protein S6 [Salidesulfovibrio onnuriiensis]|uniref:30S ribosomal protein S6 n=1 Tax=Salidesulfovibrio onnuriiensis TaxID=2583823 RepID=UPI0011CB672E|nr:30S ribosomal protein S6 [Salidesulfovibrio onnuriiensis]
MANYETLLLLSPELGEDGRKEIMEKLAGVISSESGEIVEVDEWGMRTLSYPVQKQTRGYYIRLVYSGPGPIVAELERNIRITDGIFKFMTVKLEKAA